jgi:hypothetical protein
VYHAKKTTAQSGDSDGFFERRDSVRCSSTTPIGTQTLTNCFATKASVVILQHSTVVIGGALSQRLWIRAFFSQPTRRRASEARRVSSVVQNELRYENWFTHFVLARKMVPSLRSGA